MNKIIEFLKRKDIRYLESISASTIMIGFAIYSLIIGKSAFYITALIFYSFTTILRLITLCYYKLGYPEYIRVYTVSIFSVFELIIMPLTMIYAMYIKEDYNNVFGIMIYAYSCYGVFKFFKATINIFRKKNDYSDLVNHPFFDLITSFYTLFLLTISLTQVFGNPEDYQILFIVLQSIFMVLTLASVIILFILAKKEKQKEIMLLSSKASE